MAMEQILNTDRGRFVVRPYRPEDERGVLDLWRAAFEKEMDQRLWAWKYLQGPFKHQIAVCTDEEEHILVLYGGIPFPAYCKGERVTITQLMDIMSHPSCRGSGLFVQTAEAFFRLFAGPRKTVFYYGFPGGYHFRIGEKYLDYRPLNQGMGYLTASTKELAGKKSALGYLMESVGEEGASMDETWGRLRGDYPFSVVRDAAFVRWRFFDHPFFKYDVWGCRSIFGRRYAAYAVVSTDGGTARLVDILAPPSERIIAGILGRLAAHYHRRGVDTIVAWIPKGHFLERTLVSFGFAPSKEPFGIIPTGRSFDPSLDYGWASTHLYYTMADGDLI